MGTGTPIHSFRVLSGLLTTNVDYKQQYLSSYAMKLHVDIATSFRCKATQLLRRASQSVGPERDDLKRVATEYARLARERTTTEHQPHQEHSRTE